MYVDLFLLDVYWAMTLFGPTKAQIKVKKSTRFWRNTSHASSFFQKKWPATYLGGGFKDFLFLPLPGEMIQFDQYFSDGLKTPTLLSLLLMAELPNNDWNGLEKPLCHWPGRISGQTAVTFLKSLGVKPTIKSLVPWACWQKKTLLKHTRWAPYHL